VRSTHRFFMLSAAHSVFSLDSGLRRNDDALRNGLDATLDFSGQLPKTWDTSASTLPYCRRGGSCLRVDRAIRLEQVF
jgi:hypothetical protein